ncbi:hypothetical protein [[Flexibacter] sp. ATCC 35208]|uniref:hypothetical protein n=1 Tax=[Flexibacter] sp. ATCC 35208 TaxID=1936242 RepID=UPI0009D358AB|nr:hypothetical protein [[Flexibacter] sp. ATCC 35208]OMP79068.1 hypothetical protein BW716_11960 [[Flexibacter] sp. ATCC 35208]
MAKLLPVKTNLSFLDGFRGLAALYVATGPAPWLLWEGGESFRQAGDAYGVIGKAFALGMSMCRFGLDILLFIYLFDLFT